MNRWILRATLATVALAACSPPEQVLRRDLEVPTSDPTPPFWVTSVVYEPTRTRVVLSAHAPTDSEVAWYPSRSFLQVEGLAYPPEQWTGPTTLSPRTARLTLVFALDRRLSKPGRLVLAHQAGEAILEIPGAPGAETARQDQELAGDQSGTGP